MDAIIHETNHNTTKRLSNPDLVSRESNFTVNSPAIKSQITPIPDRLKGSSRALASGMLCMHTYLHFGNHLVLKTQSIRREGRWFVQETNFINTPIQNPKRTNTCAREHKIKKINRSIPSQSIYLRACAVQRLLVYSATCRACTM